MDEDDDDDDEDDDDIEDEDDGRFLLGDLSLSLKFCILSIDPC